MLNSLLISPFDLADAAEVALQQRAAQDDLEHAVYGFDTLDELGLHPVLAQGFEAAGWGVWREQRYPGHRHKRSKASGWRCDFALTPQGRALREPDVASTLFDPADAVDLQEAYWLEVKLVAQFETQGPFRRYSAELLAPVTKDVKKLWSDDQLRFGGLMLVLFTQSREVAEHDLKAWYERCLSKGLPVYPPATRGFPITDRIGNAWCSVGVFGVRGV